MAIESRLLSNLEVVAMKSKMTKLMGTVIVEAVISTWIVSFIYIRRVPKK